MEDDNQSPTISLNRCQTNNSVCKIGKGSVYYSSLSGRCEKCQPGGVPYALNQARLFCWSWTSQTGSTVGLFWTTGLWAGPLGTTGRSVSGLIFIPGPGCSNICCVALWQVKYNTSASLNHLLLSPFTPARPLDSLLLIFTSSMCVEACWVRWVTTAISWPYEGWMWRIGLINQATKIRQFQ